MAAFVFLFCYRFPFLLVDRVIEYNPGVSVVAIKNVTINDNFFPGHFPDRPIMPGVLMVEVFLSSLSPLQLLIHELNSIINSLYFPLTCQAYFESD